MVPQRHPDTAWAEWKQTGILPWKTEGFVRLGISPVVAKVWAGTGLDASAIKEFIANDIPADRALDWVKAGVDPSDVDEFIEIGIDPSELAAYGTDGIQPYQVTRTETGYQVELEPWQKDPADQLPQVIEPGRIRLSLWSSSPWQDEPLECAVSMDWDGKRTVDWSVVSGMGMSMMSEVWFSGIAGWPDGVNVELIYASDSGERGVDWLPDRAPTAGNSDRDKDRQRWVQLASSLVGLTEGLLDSGIQADDEFTNKYYDSAKDEWIDFDQLFRIYLASVVPTATTGFKHWLTNALEEGTYTIDESA